MIVKYSLVILCVLIVDANAGKIDCKAIDKEKFNDLFVFKYSGGSVGLKFDFNFVGNTNSFKVHDCTFEITRVRTSLYGAKNLKPQATKNKLNGLQGCTKYNIYFDIKNSASKKSFSYENAVTTKPDAKINKIDLAVDEVGASFIRFSYKSSTAGCIEQYVAVLKDNKKNEIKNMTLSQNMSTFDDLTSSKSYTVQIIAFDDKGSKMLSNEQKVKLISAETDNEIEDIDVELKLSSVTTNNAQFKWDLTDDSDLKLNYKLSVFDLNGSEIFSNTTNDNLLTVENLKSCANYLAIFSIIGSSKLTNLTFTTARSEPSPPRNVSYHANHTHSMISWIQPEINPNCVLDYTVKCSLTNHTSSSDLPEQTVDGNQTSVVISRLPYSMKIFIHVYANYDTSNNATRNSKAEEFENFNADDFVVTTIREFRLTATEVQLQWSFNTSFTDYLKNFQVFFDDETIEVKKPLINLNIQACNKNYTVTIRCVSKGGNVGPISTYQTHLNDKEVLLSVIDETNINVDQNNEKLMVMWRPNENEASCIADYEVKFAEQVLKTRQPKMEIDKFESCMLYQLSITPISVSGKRGETTFYEFETNVLVPSQPSKPSLIYATNRELKISSSISDKDKRCLDTSPTFVEFTCNDFVYEEKITESHTQYTATMQHLHPNTNYECVVVVKNSIGSSKNSEAALFKTLQDSPKPPDKIIANVIDNAVEVKWSENNSTGFADYYEVHVTFAKFLYDLGKGCLKQFKNKSVVEVTGTSIVLNSLHPFSQYKLKIKSSNVYGKSNFSEEIVFHTKPSRPTEPRNIAVKLKTNENNSSVSAIVAWKSPCMMNGKFSLYTIALNGYRKGVESDKRTEASAFEEIELHNLSNGFKYDVKVQAVNQNDGSTSFSGAVAEYSFKTLSGLPEEDDLKDWTNVSETINSKNIEIFLKRRLFVSKVGDITGITFLIFLADCLDLPQPTYGYFSSDNDSLSSSQNELKCSELYQQTGFLVNPIADNEKVDLDSYSLKFILGNEDCSKYFHENQYCNGQLTCSDCSYGIMARVFTNSGYRDTEPVIVKINTMASLLVSPKVLLVGGSVFALVLASLIICLICCVGIRKNKRKMKKKKEAAETVENLLSFTSYCVIDKNPVPKNQFDHLL